MVFQSVSVGKHLVAVFARVMGRSSMPHNHVSARIAPVRQGPATKGALIVDITTKAVRLFQHVLEYFQVQVTTWKFKGKMNLQNSIVPKVYSIVVTY